MYVTHQRTQPLGESSGSAVPWVFVATLGITSLYLYFRLRKTEKGFSELRKATLDQMFASYPWSWKIWSWTSRAGTR